MSFSEQQIINSGVAGNLIGLSEIGAREQLLPYFMQQCHLLNDVVYWQLLGTIWQDSPNCTLNILIWRKLFSSSRSRRHKLMKKKDRQVWRKLPFQNFCYRAILLGEDVDKAICWTLSKEAARFFQKQKQAWGNGDGEIVERIFPKNRIIAYFDRRSEHEVIVL